MSSMRMQKGIVVRMYPHRMDSTTYGVVTKTRDSTTGGDWPVRLVSDTERSVRIAGHCTPGRVGLASNLRLDVVTYD